MRKALFFSALLLIIRPAFGQSASGINSAVERSSDLYGFAGQTNPDPGISQAQLLDKIEQLTQYTIDLSRRIDSLTALGKRPGNQKRSFDTYWTAFGNNIANTNSGNVGIGTGSPGATLDVAGNIHSAYGLITDQPGTNGISAWIRGGSNVGGNLVVQGDVAPGTAWPAWWISGGSGYLKIGSNGGSEPTSSPINIDLSGHVGINTTNTTGYQFNVNGSAVFDAVTVKAFSSTGPRATPWADYVFDKDYQLPSLESLAAYIRANHHLPGIPVAAEVEKNGLDLGVNQAKLLEKIEQLTLYTIDLQKQADQSRATVEALQQQVEALKKSNSNN